MYMPINAGFQKIFIWMEVWEWPTHKKGHMYDLATDYYFYRNELL